MTVPYDKPFAQKLLFDMLRIQAEDGEQRELYFTFRRLSRKRTGPSAR